jgi:two-component system NtrC family sensor kinase
MKTIVWVGDCSPEAQFLKNQITTSGPSGTSTAPLKNLIGQKDPFLIISENLNVLMNAAHKHPQSLQLFICRASAFIDSFQMGVRPLNRYFFLIDQQSPEQFQHLIAKLETKAPTKKKAIHSQGPMTSMQNSLEVLKRITEDRLFELKNFSYQEEERRKHFRALIQLARRLSMSKDIEEVVQYLWHDLRTIDGLTSMSFLIVENARTSHRIIAKSGKFHFEETVALTASEIEDLQLHFRLQDHDQLRLLTSNDVPLFHKLLGRSLSNPVLSVFAGDQSEKNFFLILETQPKWHMTEVFKEHLSERLSFIQLTLEKYLLQEEIKSKANLWETTFNELQDPLAIITQKRILVRSNQQFQKVGDTLCHKVWIGSDSLCPPCPKNVTKTTQFEIQKDDRLFHTRLFPIQGEVDKTPQAFIAHYVDVTTERTLYSRLVQSEKMIAVGKLAGDLSQALSLPLSSIHSIARKLMETPTLERQTEVDLSEIAKASQRSLRIIEDFENFSQGNIHRELIMAETVVEKTIPLVKALLHGHRFHLQLSEKKHPILASLSLLQQVLYNLLRNAHQAMKSHGEIQISTESKSFGEVPGVQISVLDSGTGVSAEVRTKIFQPFVTSKVSTEGTGLGLNIVKQIIESHRGQVGYEPRLEGGSKFWIWMPIERN